MAVTRSVPRILAELPRLPHGAMRDGTAGRILAAGLQLFARNGYHGTSIRLIGEAIELKPPNLYAYFKSKEHLLAELVRVGHEEHLAQLRRAVIAAGGAPIDQIRELVRAHVRTHAEYPMLASVANSEMHALSPDLVAPSLVLRSRVGGDVRRRRRPRHRARRVRSARSLGHGGGDRRHGHARGALVSAGPWFNGRSSRRRARGAGAADVGRGRGTMMRSTMQDGELSVAAILRHGEAIYGDSEVATLEDGWVRRARFATVAGRARRLAAALQRLGVGPGDRVGSFSWNTQEHLEAYLAVPSIGAVLHTINIRLHPDEVAYLVNHARDRIVLVDACLVPTLAQAARRFEAVERIVVVGGGDATLLGDVLRYEDLLAAAPPALRSGRRSTSGRRRSCVTRAAPPGGPRASSTATARPGCTRCRCARARRWR